MWFRIHLIRSIGRSIVAVAVIFCASQSFAQTVTITNPPQNVIAIPGETVSFSVAATGADTLNFQWQENGTNLDGETNDTLDLTNVQSIDAGTYTVTVTNAVPEVFASALLVVDTNNAYLPISVGSPVPGEGQTTLSNGYQISGGGAGLAYNSTNDQFQFGCQPTNGNFDVQVQVISLGLSETWAEAGLMARQSLASNSPYAAALATPTVSGEFFLWRSPTNRYSATTGNLPVNYPNTWLRLKRCGDVFTGYGSFDGQNWTELGCATIVMTDPIYIGLATSSFETNGPTTAQYGEITPVGTNAVVVSAQLNPHEPIGPSSRKTGIVFSEIMYKPAPRADTNNCEFVEIFNSQPWFHDISGYQITCADMNYTFPPSTIIPGGGYLVVAASPGSIQNVYGITNVMGPYNGSLKKSETLELLDEQSNVVLTVPYSATYPWPVAADGTGHSIVLANPSYGEGDPRAWDISDVIGGSPGTMETYRPNPLRNVVINEVLPHSENPAVPQFIELYNHSTQSVDISGCILTDNPGVNEFVIPAGTVLGPGGFVSFNQAQLGFLLNGAGETLYFIQSDNSRVLDAVQFEAQADGVSWGRWPDGANDFYPLQASTPGTNNSAIVIGNIVINELMYDPISNNDDDQYIELYNQGSNAVNLGGWQFTAGVTYTFPTNAVIPANGYVVVGRNIANLMGKYTNLTTGNTFGNYSGKLSHNGERVALAMPQSLYGTNAISVVEDEVTYGTGGRWGQWSSGGGSSMELIDPRSNHRLAANWADSDETQKSSWVDIENTWYLENGANYGSSIQYAQLGLLDAGECLVDNVEVDFNGSNYVINSTFEGGLDNWSLQGDHSRSTQDTGGYQSEYALHIRASDRFWSGVNSCQATLYTNKMRIGSNVTLRFKARWLRGWPEAILRLNGNWLEATGPLQVPSNLGTPGARNSTAVTNAGPAIYQVSHSPALPPAGQPVVVTARVHDSDGVQSLVLNYRIDPSTNYTAVAMNDSGTNGDMLAGDGIFSATIPGQTLNTVAAFYLTATDKTGVSTVFPSLLSNNAPVRECVVMFGDGTAQGPFGSYHVWITQTNITRWANLSDLSNEGNDFTFVNNGRIIYNALGHYSGSPYHQLFDTPVGNLCHYDLTFPDDDMFLGTTSFNKLHQPGNAPGDDLSLQREQVANTFLRALGVPWLNRRYVAVFVNGNRRGTLMEDAQVPNSDVVKEHYPNDSGGFLFKMQPWFEFAPEPDGQSIGADTESWCVLVPVLTPDEPSDTLDLARYRYMFEIRRTPDSDNDFSNVISLVNAANSYQTPSYVANMKSFANMENWMRVFAANHAAGNWDTFGGQTGQNLYGYIGTQGTKYSLHMWDFNLVIGNDSLAPGQDLFLLNPADSTLAVLFSNPEFQRMYWRAFEELANGQMLAANSDPLIAAKYQAFVNSGFYAENPINGIYPWLNAAQETIASEVTTQDAASFVTYPILHITNNTATIDGTAPFVVDTITVNGAAWPLIWTDLNDWSITVPLQTGTNELNIVGLDRYGNPVDGASHTLEIDYTPALPSPVGQVVINEIMYDPALTNAQYVELFNNSTNTEFDLSGWTLSPLSYVFPPGSTIAPNGFIVLAENEPAYASAYGAADAPFDIFPGTLPQSGQTLLSLVEPGNGSNLVVAEVEYSDQLPWPTNVSGTGSSLQLIDPLQDNWRVGNWSGAYPPTQLSPNQTNTSQQSLPAFPPLWINEIQAENINGITNDAGQRSPWIEIFNPTTNAVSLSGLFLANDLTDLTNWAFPSEATIGPGAFEIVFADNETNLTTSNELHTSFTLAPTAGGVALSRLQNGQPQVLDYIIYSNLPPNYSYGSYPDGQSFVRAQFFQATPGASNNNALPNAVPYFALGTVYAQNFDSLPNPGTSTVDSDNPVTINGTTYATENPLAFADPIRAAGAGGLGLMSTMPGWFGLAADTMKVGASAGDQSTGGIISFGTTGANSTNRALGLLSTSSTGPTAFGLALLNETTNIINEINLSYVGELWRQQPSPKSLSFSYYIDPTGTNAFSTAAVEPLTALDVNFLTGNFSPMDGTQPGNQTYFSVTNQAINAWPPGAALWLVWQMTNDAGSSQGLAIDNLNFSANSTLVAPLITQQPQSQIVSSGNNPSFTVAATSAVPIAYQWLKDGTNIAATNATLAFNDVGTNDTGAYSVILSNQYGSTISGSATLTVQAVTGGPVIDLQPQSQTNFIGGSAVFAVTAGGSPPLTYQWLANGTNISGANAATLSLSNLTATNQGTYAVQITDSTSITISSENVYLTVVAQPPSIITQPLSQRVPPDANATLTVAADGSAPLTYQWMLDGNNLTDSPFFSGTTNATLTVHGFQSTEAGSYTVIVTNAGGYATSAAAVLTALAPSYLDYQIPGSIYVQDFNSLPDPGSVTVNTANPVVINWTTYSLANPVDFGYPIESAGNGGFGLYNTMAGWYGYAGTGMKVGASAGDQTTGGIISFGPTSEGLTTNRSLGLLATGTSGATAFGLGILNQTLTTLTNMTVSFTGELWRQQTTAKTLSFSYYVDPTGTRSFSPANLTAALPGLDVAFPTDSSADGTGGPLMTEFLSITNQPITNCPPGAALWLIWQMSNDASSGQGLGIDNLTFSADGPPSPYPIITQSGSSVVLSWPDGLGYALQMNNGDVSQTNQWVPANVTMVVSNQLDYITIPITNQYQFFRLAGH